MRSFKDASYYTVLFEKVKDDVMGGACSTHERFWSESLKEREHSEDLGVDGKDKVKRQSCPCAFLTEHHAMKAYWGVEVYLHAFFTSELDGDEWSASCSGHLTWEDNIRMGLTEIG
jgi:hypothetical protein